MNKFLLKTGLFSISLLFIILGFNSCRKEKPTLATISVTNSLGEVVEDAMVRLYPVPTTNPHPSIIIDDTLFTDFEGKCTFDYTEDFNLGQAGFAVLDIEVTMVKITNGEDSLIGSGIIKIEPEVSNEAAVIIF